MNFWLFWGIITFVANFSVHLLIAGNFGGALITGAVGLVTAIATVSAMNWFRNQGADTKITNLRNQIRLLQRRRAEAYQAMADMAAERERVALALSSMQNQIRHYEVSNGSIPRFIPQFQASQLQASQLQSQNLQPAQSWDLSAQPNEEPNGFTSDLSMATAPFLPHDENLNQFLANAHATKQVIIASLNQLQVELDQQNDELNEQRQTRDKLTHEIYGLMQQRQQMAESAKALQADLDSLAQYRVEMDQYLAYVEGKKKELENGSNPLQQALKELQDQADGLQEELNHLEQQIHTRRAEKGYLKQEIIQLKQEQMAAKVEQEQVVPLQQEFQRLQTEIKPLREELQKLDVQIQNRRQEKEALMREITQFQAQKSSLRQQLSASDTTKPKAIAPKATAIKTAATKVTTSDLPTNEITTSDLPTNEITANGLPISQPAESQGLLPHRPSSKPKQSHNSKKQPLISEPEKPNGKGTLGHSSKAMGSTDDSLWESQIQRIPVWQESLPAAMDEVETKEHSAQELSDLWADFMVQLPAYEFQALKAIALEKNPMGIVDRIAEVNFTTPGELIDAINQRAVDIVGEEVIHFRSGFAPPAIARDHVRTIKKLIETYEYLTE